MSALTLSLSGTQSVIDLGRKRWQATPAVQLCVEIFLTLNGVHEASLIFTLDLPAVMIWAVFKVRKQRGFTRQRGCDAVGQMLALNASAAEGVRVNILSGVIVPVSPWECWKCTLQGTLA